MAALQEHVIRNEVVPSDPKLQQYLALRFKDRPFEELHVLFVDRENGFIGEEQLSVGEQGSVAARIAPMMRRAFELGADGIYLVHNHPSGSPLPSTEDIRSTRRIVEIAGALEITVHDHLIVAGRTITSLRDLSLI